MENERFIVWYETQKELLYAEYSFFVREKLVLSFSFLWTPRMFCHINSQEKFIHPKSRVFFWSHEKMFRRSESLNRSYCLTYFHRRKNIMRQEEIVDMCSECGKMWDSDGCQITGNGPFHVAEFVCEGCKQHITEEEEML